LLIQKELHNTYYTLEEIYALIYSAAMTATVVHNKNKNSNNQLTGNKNKNTKPS